MKIIHKVPKVPKKLRSKNTLRDEEIHLEEIDTVSKTYKEEKISEKNTINKSKKNSVEKEKENFTELHKKDNSFSKNEKIINIIDDGDTIPLLESDEEVEILNGEIIKALSSNHKSSKKDKQTIKENVKENEKEKNKEKENKLLTKKRKRKKIKDIKLLTISKEEYDNLFLSLKSKGEDKNTPKIQNNKNKCKYSIPDYYDYFNPLYCPVNLGDKLAINEKGHFLVKCKTCERNLLESFFSIKDIFRHYSMKHKNLRVINSHNYKTIINLSSLLKQSQKLQPKIEKKLNSVIFNQSQLYLSYERKYMKRLRNEIKNYEYIMEKHLNKFKDKHLLDMIEQKKKKYDEVKRMKDSFRYYDY